MHNFRSEKVPGSLEILRRRSNTLSRGRVAIEVVNSMETTEQFAERKSLLTALPAESSGTAREATKKRIAFFGHFGRGNFGNESTLQAMLCHLRSLLPDTEFQCICTGPDVVEMAYNISTVPSRDTA